MPQDEQRVLCPSAQAAHQLPAEDPERHGAEQLELLRQGLNRLSATMITVGVLGYSSAGKTTLLAGLVRSPPRTAACLPAGRRMRAADMPGLSAAAPDRPMGEGERSAQSRQGTPRCPARLPSRSRACWGLTAGVERRRAAGQRASPAVTWQAGPWPRNAPAGGGPCAQQPRLCFGASP